MAGDMLIWDGGLCVTADDNAWVGGHCKITLVDSTGVQTTRKVGSGMCDSIARTDDNRCVYVSCSGDRCIYKLSQDHAVLKFASLTFRPRGLVCLHPNTLLVCGGACGVFIVTGRGGQKVELPVHFKRAFDVAVNENGDICITDPLQHKVFTFDYKYKHLGTYSMTSGHDIFPYCVTSNGDNFVISDNNVIHVIDRDCDHLATHTIANDNPALPSRLDMSSSNSLWIKFSDGRICVYGLI